MESDVWRTEQPREGHASAPVLEVDHLTKRYGAFTALRDAHFDVRPGEVFGLLGPNGAGKSTMLHCLTGITRPTSGEVRVQGHPATSREAKREFGFVPDDLPLPENLTGAEYLRLVGRLYGGVDAARVEQLLELFGLELASRRLVSGYSHGMKRKLQTIAALSHDPSLLILDEPLRGLDPEAALTLKEIIRTWVRKSGSVLMATHDLLAAEVMCDRVAIVSQGELKAVGVPADLVRLHDVASLEEVFLRVAGLEERAALVRERLLLL